MKKIITMVFAVASVAVVAQKNLPVYLVDGILSSSAAIHRIDPNEIASLSIYKSVKNLPAEIQAFAPFTKEGIIDIALKHKAKSEVITARQLNAQHHLTENHDIIINDIKTTPDNIKIFKDSIAKQTIINENGSPMLRIETADEEFKPKPGEILIRGNK